MELPESLAHFFQVAVVELTQLGGKTTMIDRTCLVQRCRHLAVGFVVVGMTK